MRILISVHHFPPNYSAGAELRAFRTARWMIRNGHEVHIICVENILYDQKEELSFRDDIYQGIPVRRLFFDIKKANDRFRWEYENPWIEDHLKLYLSELMPDIFHQISGYLIGAGGIRAAKSLGIPCVVTLTDFWFFCPRLNLLHPDGKLSNPYGFNDHDCARCKFEEKRRYRLPAKSIPWAADLVWSVLFNTPLGELAGIRDLQRRFTLRYQILTDMLKEVDAIVCPTKLLIETLKSREIDRNQVYFISHGLDVSGWLPVQQERQKDHTFRIGYMGQLETHKGVHLIIEAAKQLSQDCSFELLIYGNERAFPNYVAQLRQLAGSDPRIKFLGSYENEQVANILSQFDVLVIPSIWPEIGPWVMFEALEMKVPVISTDLPNMAYIIEHERNGLLFKKGVSKDLHDQLERLILDPEFRDRLISNIGPVKKIEEEMSELEKVYRTIVN